MAQAYLLNALHFCGLVFVVFPVIVCRVLMSPKDRECKLID